MSTGISFPIRLNPGLNGGGLTITTGNQRVQEQILEILETSFLERVLRPGFGTEPLLFQAVSSSSIITSQIQFALNRFLSANIETTVNTDVFTDGRVIITIRWTDTSDNLAGVVRREMIV